MQRKIRLLLVEDREHDAALIISQLRRQGFEPEWHRVDCEAEYLLHLDSGLDAILSDYTLPSFDVTTALRLLRERQLDVPFIVISGTIGEERAVEVLKQGAADYLLKDRLQRLGDAVIRVMEARVLQRDFRRAQDALHQSERRYRLMFENNPQPTWIFDPDTYRFLDVNSAVVDSYGYSRDEFLGMTILDIHRPDDRPLLLETLKRDVGRFDQLGAFNHQKKNGSIIDVEVTSHEVDVSGRPVRVMISKDITARRRSDETLLKNHQSDQVESGVGIGIDVTQRRELEAQLRQAQKMEAVGQLAGGIAHDFNNLLTAILGYAELLAPVLKDKERQRKDLEEIHKAAVRATRLTSQLLAFSRRQIMQPIVIDLNALVTEVSALLHRLIGEDIRLKLELDSSLGRTKADPGQIEQVIVNLAINARDAMASGGTLTVQTTNLDVDDEFFQRHGFANESDTNRFVVLSITDTGCGMEPAVKQRVFEPFFTTKPKGKGTGLGLATVYGIVKQSGGSIWAYSEPGHGTTFKIYLPRTDQTVQTDLATMPVQAPLHGTETILLVEDEDAVRMLSLALLERQGYHVLVAADAEQALRIAESGSTPIDLLVTDVVMPGQSGPELFARLGPHRPGMRVLFLSGYTDEAIVKRGVLRASTPFLQKPFTATALSTKVRELLDGDAPHL